MITFSKYSWLFFTCSQEWACRWFYFAALFNQKRTSVVLSVLLDKSEWISKSYIPNVHRPIGLVGRVFTNGLGERGSIPRRHTKDSKMVLDTSLPNIQHYNVRIKDKVEQSRKRVAPTLTPRCSSYWKRSLRVSLDYSRHLTYYYARLFPLHRDIGPAVRVFASGPGDLGSIPGRVIPKTLKMVLDTTLLNTQHYKVRFKGKVEQSWEWSSALPYTLV